MKAGESGGPHLCRTGLAFTTGVGDVVKLPDQLRGYLRVAHGRRALHAAWAPCQARPGAEPVHEVNVPGQRRWHLQVVEGPQDAPAAAHRGDDADGEQGLGVPHRQPRHGQQVAGPSRRDRPASCP